MARGPTYRVPWRRRREGKTDYYKRLKLISSGKPRLVVRISLNYATVQIIEAAPQGDIVIAAATSKDLQRLYGWKGGGKNTCATYLTAMLAAYRALQKGVREAVLDIGLREPVRGSKVFAALKGALDAGLKVPHSPEVLPGEDRIKCEHIAKWASSMDSEELSKRFSRYLERGLKPQEIPSHVVEVKERMAKDYAHLLAEVMKGE